MFILRQFPYGVNSKLSRSLQQQRIGDGGPHGVDQIGVRRGDDSVLLIIHIADDEAVFHGFPLRCLAGHGDFPAVLQVVFIAFHLIGVGIEVDARRPGEGCYSQSVSFS